MYVILLVVLGISSGGRGVATRRGLMALLHRSKVYIVKEKVSSNKCEVSV